MRELEELRESRVSLEDTFSGMEALLVEKQSELTKMRETARVYLKETSADERNMEKRMKAEGTDLGMRKEQLKSHIADSKETAKAKAEKMENYLFLVSEKQKNDPNAASIA